MKTENIQRIMRIAKGQKPMLRLAVTVVDYITGDKARRAGTKITCIDEFKNVLEVDEVDESCVCHGRPAPNWNTICIETENEEMVSTLVKFWLRG